MTTQTIQTPSGPIQLVVNQKYTLSSLLALTDEQADPFLQLFRIGTTGSEGVSDLIRILATNSLIEGEDEMLSHPQFYHWLSKPGSEIESIMSQKGIWFKGMGKYMALKVLLLSHRIIVDTCITPITTITSVSISPITIPPFPPGPQPVPSNISPGNTDYTPSPISIIEKVDRRKTITTGTHYETLPPRDFDIYRIRATLRSTLLRDHFGNNGMITTFTADHLEVMYKYYDKHSFNGVLSRMVRQQKHQVLFSTNLTSQSKAGQHSYDPKTKNHTVKVSPHIIGQLFTKGERNIKSNGLIITDRLGGLISVFEHEITHLYCSLMGYTRKINQGQGKMYYGPHGKLFQALVFRVFGHTDFRHSFNHGEATDQLDKNMCRVGMAVFFDNNGRVYGKIQKINPKRCKVNTEDGSVYNVPYSMLRHSDRGVTVPEKKTPDPETIKNKYRVGMKVKFRHGKKNITGTIIKCNPKRARVECSIGTYDVSYTGLI